MHTYIALLTFTDQGSKELKQTTRRAEEFRKMVEKRGIKILQTFWLNGPFDGIHIFEAENEDEAMAHSMSLSSFGNAKTQTYRAYSRQEIEPILDSIPKPYDLIHGE